MKERLYTFVDAYRRHLSVAAYVVVAVCVALVTYVGGTYFLGNEKVYAPSLETAKATSTPALHLVSSRPARLIIPKLKIDAPFEILDLNPDKTVGVPKEYTTVGWYSGSKTPGEIGPSVILGHVDSYKGPAVFFYLGRLDKGDRFTIKREDGTDATFEVDNLERYPQSDFPTDKVYGPIAFAGIRLITCSGKYDHCDETLQQQSRGVRTPCFVTILERNGAQKIDTVRVDFLCALRVFVCTAVRSHMLYALYHKDMTFLSRSGERFLCILLGCALVFGFILVPRATFAGAANPPLDFTGYAWSDNVGWISLNCINTASCASSSYKVSLDTSTNNVSGYAWSDSAGWIEFSGPNSIASCPGGATCAARKVGSSLSGWARVVLGDGLAAPIQSPQATSTFPSGQSWPVPSGVTNIQVKAWGAGGGAASTGIGGGGGGAQADFTVTPNENLTINIGAGGSIAGTNGGNTQLLRGATSLLSAGGGNGSTNGSNAGGGNFGATGAATYSGGQTGGTPQPPYTSDPSYQAGVGVGGVPVFGGMGVWSNTGKTLPGGLGSSNIATIGNNIFLFGGTSNVIYAASTSNPTTWVNTGKTMPDTVRASHMAIIGNNIYLFGGVNSNAPSGIIYVASTSNPTTWVNTGKTLPGVLASGQLVTVGSSMYIFGGLAGGSSATNVIYAASTSNPTVWINTGKTLPGTIGNSQAAVIGSTIYLFGGYDSGGNVLKVIYSAPVANPTAWVNTGALLPVALSNSQVAVVGTSVYLFGGITSVTPTLTNDIFAASTSNPTVWVNTPKLLPSQLSNSALYNSGTALYLLGGLVASYGSTIYTAPLTSAGGVAGGPGFMTISYTASQPAPSNGSDGWISLSSANGGGSTYGVTVGTNSLGGQAWGSEVMGWIDFSAVNFTPPCGSPSNSCSLDHTQSINTDAWCTIATTTCAVGNVCKDSNGLCGPASSSGTLTLSNQKVKRGNTVNISWNALYYDTCTITGTNGDTWTWPSSTPAAMPLTSAPIQNETTYTLTCVSASDPNPPLPLDTKKVTLIPAIREF